MVQRSAHAQHMVMGIVSLMIAAVISLLICMPTYGHAAEQQATGSDPVVDDEPDELQQLVESTGTAYTTAVTEKAEIEQQIIDLEKRIAEIEEQLPAAQDEAADSIYILYRLQLNSNGLVELLLSTDDFNSFITMLEYLENISSFSTENLIELNDLVTDLKQAQEDLNNAFQDMTEKEEEAQQALANAQAAREEKERQAAQTVAEEAAARTANNDTDDADDTTITTSAAGETTKDAKGSDTSDTDTTDADGVGQAQDVQDATASDDAVSDEPAAEEPATEEPAYEEPAAEEPVYEEPAYEEPVYEEPVYEEPVYEEPVYEEPAVEETTPAVSERDAFIAEWGPRINNYLAGSPLAGYGETFAAAAWDYDVDPRWSPAIAYVESSLGRYCNVGSYNAWGWDHTSWGSWEEGIYAHVQGLANGYGYTITEAAAQKYCPPSWQNWYNNVSAQMSRI